MSNPVCPNCGHELVVYGGTIWDIEAGHQMTVTCALCDTDLVLTEHVTRWWTVAVAAPEPVASADSAAQPENFPP